MMKTCAFHIRSRFIRKAVALFVAAVFAVGGVIPPATVLAAESLPVLDLPAPGTLLPPSDSFAPALIRGISFHPDNPLKFDFVIHPGDAAATPQDFQTESDKLVKYFLAALTTPDDDLWVNLSPYEADRIIPEGFGRTRLGRDMLAQDYLLKQLTASLMYPEEELGQDFWRRVYQKAQARFGTTEIPMNTFNKVWIVPETATVFAEGRSVYVVDAKLKVMLESDYLSLAEHHAETGPAEQEEAITADIVRDVLIPEIEKEVNTGRTFANLRQIFSAVVLATWYKQNLKESLLGQVYVDRGKTAGIDNADRQINQRIYDRYVAAFEKGVYNYIREDYDPVSRQSVPRKYFSGGVQAKVNVRTDASMLSRRQLEAILTGARAVAVELQSPDGRVLPDAAVLARERFEDRLGQSITMEEWAALELLGRDELIAIYGKEPSGLRQRTRRWRRDLDRRLGGDPYTTEGAMDTIFKRLTDIRTAYPDVHRRLMSQVIMFGYMYHQDPDAFQGILPVDLLAKTLTDIKEDDRADNILVLLNNVIHRGLLKEGETARSFSKKLTSHPSTWADRPDRVHLRTQVVARQPYILVVDDQPTEIEGLVTKLTEAGYTVTAAGDAEAGLQSIALHRPDMVITDVTMPGINGIEFTRRLAKAYPDLPVIVRSGDLGNKEFFPTMLSAFTMDALPNVIGVPGKSTAGLRTTNLVNVYMERVEAGEEDSAMLIQFARDLGRVGREAPIAIMVFSSVGAQRSEHILGAARQRGLGRQRVTSTDSPYGLGSHLIFNRQQVDAILSDEANAEALTWAGVPVTTDAFVAFLANGGDRYVMNREAAAVIKQAFGTILPVQTLDVELDASLATLAGALVRPYVIGGNVAEVIEGVRLALDVGIKKLALDQEIKGLPDAEREALAARAAKLEELRDRLFTRDGAFDFAHQHLFVNNISARTMAQEVGPTDRIVIVPNGDPTKAVYPDPLPDVTDIEVASSDRKQGRTRPDGMEAGTLIDDPEQALATAHLVFRALHVNRKFDARSLLIMYKNAKAIAELFGIDDIERRRRTRLETAGGYDRGYVLMRERDPKTGEVTEDNGEEGRLLRDGTLQPRVDAKKVSKRLGDWKEVQGAELARALQAKLNEEFTDIMAESRRLFEGDLSRRERLATVITNFLEAVHSLRRIAPLEGGSSSGQKEPADNAAFSEDTKGGIDLNPANYDLRVEGAVDALRLDLSPQQIEMYNVDGFVPVIINVTPLTNIPLLIGTTESPAMDRLSRRSPLE